MSNIDTLLNSFIKMVNKFDFSVGLTLTIGGQTISGNLISYKSYFQKTSEEFKNVSDGDFVNKILSDRFASFSKEAEAEEESEIELDSPFIHLSDAVIINDNKDIALGLWRGKISSIDGFTIAKVYSD